MHGLGDLTPLRMPHGPVGGPAGGEESVAGKRAAAPHQVVGLPNRSSTLVVTPPTPSSYPGHPTQPS